ncbi:hypothetical protein [Halodesulfovibrio aestuarii]|uniref:Secreted protein n=1 Tax=Halodesulfovibrio aestuarii TaxID=126333 RepID=A0A8G2FC55_9BACT|nr:hypothetical protein [Halodesulfovibrio aestuarii]SHJ67362.1 hypothetical protein SAMN05660830_02979 [Halodesulfovibrio aestuarii]
MLKKSCFLLVGCAMLLFVGCGSDNSATNTESPDTQQEMQKDTTSGTVEKGQTEDKDADVEKVMPEEKVDEDKTREEMMPEGTDTNDTNQDSVKKDDECTEKGDENMDKTTPEMHNPYEQKTSNEDPSVTVC